MGALRLDGAVYAELRGDAAASGQAVWLVVFLGVAHGAGGALRGVAFGWNPLEGAAFGLQGEVVFFVVASSAIYLLGRFALGGVATFGEVARPLAFSSVPGFLVLVAAVLSLAWRPAGFAVFPVIIAWRLAAGFVAVRQALGLGKVRSGIAVIAGTALGFAAVGVGSGGLVALLKWVGAGS
ncbi:MAG: YIP1 family protein [Chloroflexota bacterium]|nr:YIP1 family protein [Chloroflexota bacterium]